MASFAQAFTESSGSSHAIGTTVEEPNHRHRRLLRLRHHRPRGRAPEPRDECPPPHWITSSAVAASLPSARPRCKLLASLGVKIPTLDSGFAAALRKRSMTP